MPTGYSTPEEIARQKAADRRWREKNPGVKKRYLVAYRDRMRTDIEWVLKERLQLVKARAKHQGIPYSLTPEWLAAQPRRCAVTGAEFVMTKGRGPLTPAFDRINPTLGYTPDNTRIVVNWFNGAKMEWDDQQVKELIVAAGLYLSKGK